MPVADLQTWADNLELIRLPAIEADISDLQSDYLATDALLSSTIQDLGDAIDAVASDADAAQVDASAAALNASSALSQITTTANTAAFYTDTQINALRIELTALLNANDAIVAAAAAADLDAEIAAVPGTVSASLVAALNTSTAERAALTAQISDFMAVSDSVLDDTVPLLATLQDGLTDQLTTLESTFSVFLSGYTEPILMAGLDAVQAKAEANLAPLGGSILRGPLTLWTNSNVSTPGSLVHDPSTVGTFVTNDATFGECYEFPSAVANYIGAAYPIDMNPARVYKVTALARVTDNGTLGTGVDVRFKAHTAAGVTPVQSNIVSTAVTGVLIAAGVVLYTVYVAVDQSKLISYGVAASKRIDISGSSGANKLYVNFEQTNITNANAKIRMASLFVTDVTEVMDGVNALRTELNLSIGDLDATVTDILAVNVSALTGTAFATFLTDLDVDAGGNSAFVDSTATAIATLDGNAAATYALRVGVGGAAAGFEIVAANDPILGSASSIKLAARHLEILASTVRISDVFNNYPDYDMLDSAYYSSTSAAVYTLDFNSVEGLGQKFLSLAASAAAEQVESNWFSVEPGKQYYVEARSWLSVAPTAGESSTVYIEFGSLNSAQVVTPLVPTVTVSSLKIVTYGASAPASVSVTAPATARRARFVTVRAAGGTALGRSGAFKVMKKSSSNLIVDGGIYANHLDTGSAVITGTAQIADAIINNAKITGAIQSGDFDASNGWQIDKSGTAKFSNVVVRGMLSVGAISDTWEDVDTTTLQGTTTFTVLVGTPLGGVAPRGSIYLRSASFEARAPNYVVGTDSHYIDVTLRRRTKPWGSGTWDAFSTVNTWKITNGAWDLFNSSATFSGGYEDVQYQLCYQASSGSHNAVDVIRQKYVTLKEVTR